MSLRIYIYLLISYVSIENSMIAPIDQTEPIRLGQIGLSNPLMSHKVKQPFNFSCQSTWHVKHKRIAGKKYPITLLPLSHMNQLNN